MSMKARSFGIWVATIVGAFALFATSAEAGGRKHHRHNYYNDNCYRGGGGYGYYQPRYRNYYRPVRYYQPVRYVPAPVFYGPAFQIGFGFGGGGYCR